MYASRYIKRVAMVAQTQKYAGANNHATTQRTQRATKTRAANYQLT
ncbi:hypothetical protein P3J6_120864 [Pseudoalteromonas sp. 3J6]|nr:hypothetical protein P3J6_120864 [Pseudoalteromonas sp. 3J6]